MGKRKTKIYAYVDETGQDTVGKVFIVAVVVIIDGRDDLRHDLQEIEKQSKKYISKWTHSSHRKREEYIKRIIENKRFKRCCYFSVFEGSIAFADLTILATARAINSRVKENYKASIIIDGLPPSLYPSYAAGLRSLKIKTRKVRGIRDQADEFIRLADAIAGLARNSRDKKAWAVKLYKDAKKKGVIKQSK